MNKISNILRIGIVSAGIAVLAVPSSASNLIVNGSFEMPDVAVGTFGVFGSIPGWTSSMGPGIEIQDHAAGSPLDGQQLVELDSHGPSNMYQDIITMGGTGYVLSFGYSPRPGVADNGIEVYWDGSLLDTLNLSGVGNGDTAWNYYTYNVVASSGLTRLEFRDISVANSLGGYLDDVTLDVPEPGAYAFLCSMVAGGLVIRRRRK